MSALIQIWCFGAQGLPRNGGEKNYLEFIYRRPRLLVTCVYAMYAILTVRLLRLLSAGSTIFIIVSWRLLAGMASRFMLSVWGV